MNIDKTLASIPLATPDKRGQMRKNAEKWVSSGTAEQRDAAQKLLTALDGQQRGEREALVGTLLGLNTVERVIQAFTVHPITPTEAKLIQVLLDNPGSTSTTLTQALGWKAQSWHMLFGTMCSKRALYLWPAPDAPKRNSKFYSGILADLKEPENLFTIKPDVAAAFDRLGLRRSH